MKTPSSVAPEPRALGGIRPASGDKSQEDGDPGEAGPPPATPEAGGAGAALDTPRPVSQPWTSTPTGKLRQAWGEGGSQRQGSSAACPPRPSSQGRGDSGPGGRCGHPRHRPSPGQAGGQAVLLAQERVQRLPARRPWTANLPEPQVCEEVRGKGGEFGAELVRVTGNAAKEHQTVVYLQEKECKNCPPPPKCVLGVTLLLSTCLVRTRAT